MENEATKGPRYPATFVVHWPTGPVDCCENHANQLLALNKIMGGGHMVASVASEGAQCSNCVNEAK